MPDKDDKTKVRKPLAGEALALEKLSDSDLSQVASTSSNVGQVAAAKAEIKRRAAAKKPPVSERARRVTERNIPRK